MTIIVIMIILTLIVIMIIITITIIMIKVIREISTQFIFS